MDDGDIRDRLADWAAGRLGAQEARAVSDAVEGDPELKAEAAVVQRLVAGRSRVPDGLEARILAAVEADGEVAAAAATQQAGTGGPFWSRRQAGVPRWALAAAASAVLAFGTLEIIRRTTVASLPDAFMVTLEESPSPWVSDDGLMAGAPVLAGLTDEALANLLEELGG